jgi:hypothetical protein
MALLLVEIDSMDIVLHMLVELFVRLYFCNYSRALGNWTKEHPATWNVRTIVRSVALIALSDDAGGPVRGLSGVPKVVTVILSLDSVSKGRS